MSQLQENQLFANRYLLIKRLGCGAFSEVWKAEDTMADNLLVAIKIYAPDKGLDEDGVRIFSHEYSLVFNVTHQNLLRPNHFDVWEGSPFLVLPFCQRGSSKKLIGKMNEREVAKFLHDVSSGLAFLHEQNPPIIHQDIKPDNILITEEGYFKLTDFGISTRIRSTLRRGVIEMGSAGTMAYMAPERFDRNPSPILANDVWSLGATVFELMTGDAPFGDLGGISLKNGAVIPKIQGEYSEDLKQLVEKMLSKDPWDRPVAVQIKEITERYLKTGSWKESPVNKKKGWVVASVISILVIALIGGIWTWDYNRVKVRYYKDYVEQWGVPQGIGKLSRSEMSHMNRLYRFEYKKYKLLRMSHVNSKGSIIDDEESERNERPHDMLLYYTDKGDISHAKIMDKSGKVLYVKSYNDKLNTVVFQYDDEYGTEKTLGSQTIGYVSALNDDNVEKGKISRWLLEYDKNGYVSTIRYAGFQNVLVGDAHNIYGRKYVRDEKGRVLSECYLSFDGSLKATKWGLGMKKFYYDENDNWVKAEYLTVDGKPAYDDDDGVQVFVLEYDQYGNVVYALHQDADGNLMLPKKSNVAGMNYKYDHHGFPTEVIYLGIDRKPFIVSALRISKRGMEYDDNGYVICHTNYDIDGNKCLSSDGNATAKYVNDNKGNILEMWLYGLDGQLCEIIEGYAGIKMKYDSIGNMIESVTYGKDKKPCLRPDGTAGYQIEYNDKNLVTKLVNIGVDLQPCVDNDGITIIVRDYDKRGNLTKVAYYNKGGENLVLSNENIAGWNSIYDDNGNEIERSFFDKKNKNCLNSSGYAKIRWKYDNNNNLSQQRYYGLKDKLTIVNGVAGNNYKRDERGNIVEDMAVGTDEKLASGKLFARYVYDKFDNVAEFSVYDESNTPVLNSLGYNKYTCVYNNRNQVVEKRYYGTNGKLIIINDDYAIVKYEYNNKGERIKTCYYNTKEKPCCCDEGWSKSKYEFNALGKVIRQLFYDENGNPTDPSVMVPEGICKYDKWGNMIYLASLDGNGNFITNPKTGWSINRSEYDIKGNMLWDAYFDKNDQPCNLKDESYHKKTYTYDDKKNVIKNQFFNVKGKLRTNDYAIVKYKYENGNRTEIAYYDANNRLYNLPRSFNQAREVYGSFDKSGKARTCKIYNAEGSLLKSFTYDNNEGWIDDEPEWKQYWGNVKSVCPLKINDEFEIVSVKFVNNNSCIVTFCFLEVSKYNLSTSEIKNKKNELSELVVSFKKESNMPNNVKLTLIGVDKAKREIIRVIK